MTNLQIGDYVCCPRDDPTNSRIYQIVDIEPYKNSTRAPSVESYMIFDYSCNPDPYWGSGIWGCTMAQMVMVPEMVLIARFATDHPFAARPAHYEKLGVWTKKDYNEKVWGHPNP